MSRGINIKKIPLKNISKINLIKVEEEKFYFSLSFDIDDFIGDGIWWLQIFDNNYNLIYDKPFSSSMGILSKMKVMKIIKVEFLNKYV